MFMKAKLTITTMLGGALVAFSPAPAFALKDQSRVPGIEEETAPPRGLGTAPLTQPGDGSPVLQIKPGPDNTPEPGLKPADETAPQTAPAIEPVETVELTPDLAKRALDGFIKLKQNYQDTDIAEYESLETFVANAEQGPALEKDIKDLGFKSVGEWNIAITSVSFAYAAIAGIQEDEIRQELENIKNDTNLDTKTKVSLIEGLKSMLPSDNNKKVVEELNRDKDWAAKLKQLADSDQGGDH